MLTTLLAPLMPARCPACTTPCSPGVPFCPGCSAALAPLPPPFCPCCGYPASHGQLCPACTATPPPFRAALSVFPYAGPVAAAIRRGKYGDHPWVFGRLGGLLAPMAALFPVCWIIPVPAAPSSYRQRGFNPARRLARAMLAALGPGTHAELLGGLVIRPGDAQPQASKSQKERSALPQGTFQLRAPLPEKGGFLLIDDVMTTGATLRAVAALFPVERVYALTLARTL